jgi:hypothetical protein
MKCSGPQLLTPIYLKLDDTMPWPTEENTFYLLASNGLFLCRNHLFFRSCVPVDDAPSELAAQKTFLKMNYPRLGRPLLERIIGFFDIVGARFSSEAVVLLAWDRDKKAVVPVVPDQVGIVGTTWWGELYPLELEYETPALPANLVLIGDIHSHVDGPAYASYTDKADETHRPGIHLVVGRIQKEPPEFHCEALVDGYRFKLSDLSAVMDGYRQRRVAEVPQAWLDKITIKPWGNKFSQGEASRSAPALLNSGDKSATVVHPAEQGANPGTLDAAGSKPPLALSTNQPSAEIPHALKKENP